MGPIYRLFPPDAVRTLFKSPVRTDNISSYSFNGCLVHRHQAHRARVHKCEGSNGAEGNGVSMIRGYAMWEQKVVNRYPISRKLRVFSEKRRHSFLPEEGSHIDAVTWIVLHQRESLAIHSFNKSE